MLKKLASLPILVFAVLAAPLGALAQTQTQPNAPTSPDYSFDGC